MNSQISRKINPYKIRRNKTKSKAHPSQKELDRRVKIQKLHANYK